MHYYIASLIVLPVGPCPFYQYPLLIHLLPFFTKDFVKVMVHLATYLAVVEWFGYWPISLELLGQMGLTFNC